MDNVQFHDLLNQWGEDNPMLVSPIQDEVMLSKEEINLRNRFEEKMQKLFATPSPSPHEDAYSEDRSASINMNEMLEDRLNNMLEAGSIEDRLNDMLEAGSTLLPSLTITMTVTPQVCLLAFAHIMCTRMRLF
jgi:hypothetical protein